MRIVNAVLGDATGGRWQVVCDYSRLLAAQGHEILLLLGHRQPQPPAQPPAVGVARIRSHGHYDYPAAWSLARRLKTFAPHMALAHCSRSVALLKRALAGAAPVVAVTHSNKVRRLLPADAHLALSASIRERLERAREPGRRAGPCFVVPNMVARAGSGPSPARRAGQRPRLVALGRFDPIKGLDLFIRALAELRGRGIAFAAELGGTGAERGRLERLAARLDLPQLRFPGWVEDPMGFLAGADVLCVPARADAFGLTPLQGAAAGVPLVLSRVTGHLAMFEDGTEALFADLDDAAALAREMARLLGDPALAARLREAALRRVTRDYSPEAVGRRLAEAIENIYLYWNGSAAYRIV